MEFKTKSFGELTLTELYEILKSRCEIFMLEQNIICQDMDNMDYESRHYFFEEDGRVLAYLRVFREDEDIAHMGRVFTLKHKNGMGRLLMEKSLPEIKKDFNCKKITLNAQKTAEGFYKKMGFKTVSGEFLEEGVTHVAMEKEL